MAGSEPHKNPNPEEFQYIIVMGRTSECHFRVKRAARLIKLKSTYVEKAPSTSLEKTRFRYDGWTLKDDDTPESLAMPIGEESVVNAYEVRILADGSEIPEEDAISRFLSLTFREGHKESVMRIKCTCRFRRIRQKYAQRVGACGSQIEFIHGEKKTVDDDETPESLGMAYGASNVVEVNWIDGRKHVEDHDDISMSSGDISVHAGLQARYEARMQVLKQIFTLVSGEEKANLLFDVMGYSATNTPDPSKMMVEDSGEESTEETMEQ